MERGRYDEAAPGLRQSLTFFETHFGPTNRRIIPILRNIARCHRFQSLYQAAITTTEKALVLSIQAHGEFRPPSADLLSILAISKAESG